MARALGPRGYDERNWASSAGTALDLDTWQKARQELGWLGGLQTSLSLKERLFPEPAEAMQSDPAGHAPLPACGQDRTGGRGAVGGAQVIRTGGR